MNNNKNKLNGSKNKLNSKKKQHFPANAKRNLRVCDGHSTNISICKA